MFEELIESMLHESGKIGKFYHVSPIDFGAMVEFSPRPPINQSWAEPNSPRICVSDTVEGCLVAIGNVLGDDEVWVVYVYRTAEPVEVTKPINVVDAEVTGEMWIDKNTTFERVRKIDLRMLPQYLVNDLFVLRTGHKGALDSQKRVRNQLEQHLGGKTLSQTSPTLVGESNIKVVPAPMNFDVRYKLRGKNKRAVKDPNETQEEKSSQG
jgi:hypothetical protein